MYTPPSGRCTEFLLLTSEEGLIFLSRVNSRFQFLNEVIPSLSVNDKPAGIRAVGSEEVPLVRVFAALRSSFIAVSQVLIAISPGVDRFQALLNVVSSLVLSVGSHSYVSFWSFGVSVDRVSLHLNLMVASLAFFYEGYFRNSAVIARVKTLAYNISYETHSVLFFPKGFRSILPCR